MVNHVPDNANDVIIGKAGNTLTDSLAAHIGVKPEEVNDITFLWVWTSSLEVHDVIGSFAILHT
eukprot:9216223-Karenia_brevis.AAC.1